MILYINCCIRKEDSRTLRLAGALLEKLEKLDDQVEEVDLTRCHFAPLNRETLRERTECIEKGDLSSPLFESARQFARATTLVIAAPYWDLAFPSLLKVYLENIYVTGIVSRYSEEGEVIGLCKAQKFYFVTTAGGPYEEKFSFGYLRALFENCFGVKESKLIAAQMLDVVGFDAEEILHQAIEKVQNEIF